MILRKALLALSLVLGTACATTDHEVKDIETKNVTVKGTLGNARIAINEDKEVIIQEETDADTELLIQDSVNGKLKNDLNYEAHQLERCRMDMADPALAGHGQLPEMPEIDNMKDADEVEEEFGLNEDGDLKVVKRTGYLQRLKAARKYERALRNMMKVVEKHRKECEYKMGIARNKAGLPAERYQAEGYFLKDGTWVETRKGEHSVSDAFEIQASIKNLNEN